jgi:hypothetical protein
MTESHIITGSVSKRVAVAGQIASYTSEITMLQGTLLYLDGSINQFAPEFDLRTNPTSHTNKRNRYLAKGEAAHDARSNARGRSCHVKIPNRNSGRLSSRSQIEWIFPAKA